MLDLTRAFAAFPVLETERCVLRRATLEDAEDLFRLRGDPRVTRYLARHPMASPDEARDRIRMYLATFEARSGIPWIVAERTHGRLIGTCSLWRLIPEHARAEIGYELSPPWWGKGVMAEAVAAVLDFGFTTLGLHSVEAQMDPDNAGSRRMLERLGFVQEGLFRENYYDPTQDRFTDTAVFSLLDSAWRDRAGAARPPRAGG